MNVRETFPMHCAHGRSVISRCPDCEADVAAERSNGFTPPEQVPSNQLLALLEQRSKLHDEFRLAEGRGGQYWEEMGEFDRAHSAVVDWVNEHAAELLGMLKQPAHEPPAAPEHEALVDELFNASRLWSKAIQQTLTIKSSEAQARLDRARAAVLAALRSAPPPPPEQPSATEIIRQMRGRAAESDAGGTVEVLLSDLRSAVTGMQRAASALLPRPEFEIELPNGDDRKAKVWFTEKRADGKWHISIEVSPTPPPPAVHSPQSVAIYDRCPFTGRPHFMDIEHPELGLVPTYGGPFDSFTIPIPDDDDERTLRSERFDHDQGAWVEGGEPLAMNVVTNDEFVDLHTLREERESQPPRVLPIDLINLLRERERLHDAFRLAESRGSPYWEEMGKFDAAHAAVVDWVNEHAAELLTMLKQPAHELPATHWRCFHCDEVCTDHAAAVEHFGPDRHCDPICKVDRAEYRRMEKRNIEHCLEDTELHRALHAKDAEMQTKVRQAEETGYARGLEDAKKHPEELGLRRASEPPAVGKLLGEFWTVLSAKGELRNTYPAPFDGLHFVPHLFSTKGPHCDTNAAGHGYQVVRVEVRLAPTKRNVPEEVGYPEPGPFPCPRSGG